MTLDRAGSMKAARRDDPIGDAAEATGKAVGTGVRKVDEAGRAINESAENVNARINSPAKGAFSDPEAAAQRAVEKLQGASADAMEDVQVGGRHQHVFDETTASVKGVQVSAQHQADRAGSALQRGLNDAGRRNSGPLEAVAEGAGRVAGSTVNTAERVGEGLQEAGHEVAQGAINLTEAASVAMEDATEAVADGVARTGNAVTDGYRDARDGAKDGLNRASDATARSAADAKQSTIDAGNSAKDTLNRAGRDAADGADNLAKRTAEGAGSVVGGITGAVEGVFNSIGHAFGKAGDALNDGKANADVTMRDATDSAKAAGHDARRAVDETLSDAKRDAQNAIDDLKVDHPLIEREDAADQIPVVPFTSTAELAAEHKI